MDPFDSFAPLEVVDMPDPDCDECDPNATHGSNSEEEMDVDDDDLSDS